LYPLLEVALTIRATCDLLNDVSVVSVGRLSPGR
jgi:hypothetical protein